MQKKQKRWYCKTLFAVDVGFWNPIWDLLESILPLTGERRLLSLNIGRLKFIVGLWESIFVVCGSNVGLYESIFCLRGSSLGILGVDSGFSTQFGTQEFGNGDLVINFGALCRSQFLSLGFEVKSQGIVFFFLLGLILCLEE